MANKSSAVGSMIAVKLAAFLQSLNCVQVWNLCSTTIQFKSYSKRNGALKSENSWFDFEIIYSEKNLRKKVLNIGNKWNQ